jgi:hypothetical protein
MYQFTLKLTAFQPEAYVRVGIFMTGKIYTVVFLVITLYNLVVIYALEEHTAFILTSTMKTEVVCSSEMVAPTNTPNYIAS